MIDLLLKLSLKKPAIADVGTGCGALGITAKLEIPGSSVDLYDIDSSALAVARHNAILHELHLHAYKRDLLNKVSKDYDVVLANLPYVPTSWNINRAASREPALAIRGGPDGLDLYRRLFEQLQMRPAIAKLVLTESMPPQHAALAKIAKDAGYKKLKTSDFIQVFERLTESAPPQA
jgi:release factor glutamine methyltransferase